MTRTVLLFVALASVCNGAVIPLSTSWPSTVCTRGYAGAASSGLSCLSKPCNSENEYSTLFNWLYPELRFDPLNEAALNFAGSCSCGSGCDGNDYFRGGFPEIKTCGHCIEYEPFGSNIDYAGLYSNTGFESYPPEFYSSEYYPKCMNGCLGHCKCGCCRKTPRTCLRCNKLIRSYFPGPNSCVCN